MFEEKLSYSDFEKSFLAIPNNTDLKKGVKTEEKHERENKGDLQIPVHQMRSSKTVEKKEVDDAEKPLTEYKCYYNPTSCKQSFPMKSLLDLHIDVHRGVRFLCSAPMCTKMFTSQARLRNHFEAKHKPIKPPPQQTVKSDPKPSKDKDNEMPQENVQSQKEVGNIEKKKKKQLSKTTETCDEQIPKADETHPKVESYMKQHAEKTKIGKNAPVTQNPNQVDDDWYDSDPDFNNEKLSHPGTESDEWFERLAKSVQVPGSSNIIFKCHKCTKSGCTRRAD